MRNRTCFHHASYSTLLKYYLFLGEKYSEKQIIFSCPCDRNCPRAVFSNPHHQTVHATEYCTYASDNPHVGLCHEKEDGIQKEEKTFKTTTNSIPSFFTWLWTTIITWFTSLMGTS